MWPLSLPSSSGGRSILNTAYWQKGGTFFLKSAAFVGPNVSQTARDLLHTSTTYAEVVLKCKTPGDATGPNAAVPNLLLSDCCVCPPLYDGGTFSNFFPKNSIGAQKGAKSELPLGYRS